MYRNAVLTICLGVCAVAVVAGLFIANLSSASRPINVTQRSPVAASLVPTANTVALADAPTSAVLATDAPTSAPPATSVPTSAPPATEVIAATPTAEPATAEPATAEPATAEPATAEPTSVAPTPVPVANEFVEYTVQRGDELLQLAKKYNVSTKEILDNNQIDNPDSLVVGQVLRIPKK